MNDLLYRVAPIGKQFHRFYLKWLISPNANSYHSLFINSIVTENKDEMSKNAKTNLPEERW